VRGAGASRMLDPYDRAPLERELNLFPEWFLGKHLGLELSPEERALITVTNEILINEALLQPQVFVHRDYHSRNLMVLNEGGPGVIDFQDALRGPIGYDLVSLLKDCYISWSRERVERWVRGYRRVLGTLGANVGDSEYQFMRWFDLIGVQRHIKVLGIFCRLWHRDGKIGYLADLPLTFEYVRDACRRYPELVEFERWLAWRIAPLLEPANLREETRAARRLAATAAAAVRPKRKVVSRRKAKKRILKRKAKKAVRRVRVAAKRKRVAAGKRVVRKKPVKRVAKKPARSRKVMRKKSRQKTHQKTRRVSRPKTRRPARRPK